MYYARLIAGDVTEYYEQMWAKGHMPHIYWIIVHIYRLWCISIRADYRGTNVISIIDTSWRSIIDYWRVCQSFQTRIAHPLPL